MLKKIIRVFLKIFSGLAEIASFAEQLIIITRHRGNKKLEFFDIIFLLSFKILYFISLLKPTKVKGGIFIPD